MKIEKQLRTVGLALLICLLTAGSALAKQNKVYRVSITNLTKQQVLTPPLAISHKGSFKLFKLGQAAGEGLVAIAEGGDTSVQEAILATRDDIIDYMTAAGPVLPGETVTVDIRTQNKHSRLSVVGMLATSNDAFFALNGLKLPNRKATVYLTGAYDAGSEANTELCSNVPGPPCSAESGNARMTAGAEGYVYIHNGIHGIGDLDAVSADWNNPVAKIKVKRLK